ncbi:MAG: ribonuclease III [Pseudonocardia sp.]
MARDGQAGRGRRGAVTDRAPLLVALGVDLDDELLVLALTHRSYAYEHGGLPTNERLEFLGDSVLSIVVTERLYRDHPELPEGQLAKLRASVVNMHALAGVAASLSSSGLGAYLYLGRGEELTGGRTKTSILADATEALIGAIYLEHGLETARAVIHRHFATLLRNAPLLGAGLDWKTSLQELTAAQELGVPEYRIAEDGPDHLKTFTATAVVGGRELGSGDGRTKKEAEQKAAEIAWRTLTAEANGTANGTANVRVDVQAGEAADGPQGAVEDAPDGAVSGTVGDPEGTPAEGGSAATSV